MITAHHVSVQPRVVREADTLSAEGFEVRVIARQTDPELCRYDRELMESRSWLLETIELVRNGSSHQNWFKETLNSKLSKALFDVGICKGALAPRAYVRGMNRLADLAKSKPADWFVAHT
ncbi:MAG TPA: hypothetical protein VFH91_04905, partial [Pyrinomonadaceae bacterium]|nr:hypothetical protein [Pyrinomonadaceae bacterium]